MDNVGTVDTGAGAELAPQRMSFDPLHPGLSFRTGAAPAVLVPARNGTTIAVTRNAASYAADAAVGGLRGAMVVLSHNDTATGRTQSLPVAVAAGSAAAAAVGTSAAPVAPPVG